MRRQKKLKKNHKLIDIIRLMRPQSVFLMLLFIYIPITMQTSNYYYGILQVLPLYLLLTGEIILNDYMDIQKDIINKPHRPLASGAVSNSCAAKLIKIFLFTAAISSCFTYGIPSMQLMLFIIIFLILTFYSLFPKQLAPVKAFITALTAFLCLCFIFTYSKITPNIFYYAIGAFFYISSREILMDIRDYEGDRQYQCQTLAVKYGKEKAYLLATILIILSQFIYITKIVIYSNSLIKVLCIISIFIITISFMIFKTATTKVQNKIALLLWIPMLLTIPAIII